MDSFGYANRCCSGGHGGCCSGARCATEKERWLCETAEMEASTGASFTMVMARDASPFFSHDKVVRMLVGAIEDELWWLALLLQWLW